MTPDQFTEFKALVTDFLTPVREVALRHLAWMEEQQPIPQMPNVAPPPDLSPDVQDWEPTDLTGNDGLPMVFSPSLNVYRSASRLEAASSYDGDAPPEPGNRGDERSADTAPTGDAAAV
jgi:hypothetical protein